MKKLINIEKLIIKNFNLLIFSNIVAFYEMKINIYIFLKILNNIKKN